MMKAALPSLPFVQVLRKHTLFRHTTRIPRKKTPSSLPRPTDTEDSYTPSTVILDWLQAACQELGFRDDERLLRLLHFTFSGGQRICEYTEDDGDTILRVLLKASTHFSHMSLNNTVQGVRYLGGGQHFREHSRSQPRRPQTL